MAEQYYESTGSDSSEYYGDPYSADKNRKMYEESEAQIAAMRKREYEIQHPIKWFEIYKMENPSQEAINYSANFYGLHELVHDLKNEGYYSANIDAKIAKQLYDDIETYKKVKELLQIDASLKDKIKTIMPSYSKEKEKLLDNIMKNQKIVQHLEEIYGSKESTLIPGPLIPENNTKEDAKTTFIKNNDEQTL